MTLDEVITKLEPRFECKLFLNPNAYKIDAWDKHARHTPSFRRWRNRPKIRIYKLGDHRSVGVHDMQSEIDISPIVSRMKFDDYAVLTEV